MLRALLVICIVLTNVSSFARVESGLSFSSYTPNRFEENAFSLYAYWFKPFSFIEKLKNLPHFRIHWMVTEDGRTFPILLFAHHVKGDQKSPDDSYINLLHHEDPLWWRLIGQYELLERYEENPFHSEIPEKLYRRLTHPEWIIRMAAADQLDFLNHRTRLNEPMFLTATTDDPAEEIYFSQAIIYIRSLLDSNLSDREVLQRLNALVTLLSRKKRTDDPMFQVHPKLEDWLYYAVSHLDSNTQRFHSRTRRVMRLIPNKMPLRILSGIAVHQRRVLINPGYDPEDDALISDVFVQVDQQIGTSIDEWRRESNNFRKAELKQNLSEERAALINGLMVPIHLTDGTPQPSWEKRIPEAERLLTQFDEVNLEELTLQEHMLYAGSLASWDAWALANMKNPITLWAFYTGQLTMECLDFVCRNLVPENKEKVYQWINYEYFFRPEHPSNTVCITDNYFFNGKARLFPK